MCSNFSIAMEHLYSFCFPLVLGEIGKKDDLGQVIRDLVFQKLCHHNA
ncbi:hypothetical protein M899_1379 [Bacteriovorax sp. BSW11_IV]|nr:hypothetical protein M899_1379 [Bacteriovorax sp. BSW11_IV]